MASEWERKSWKGVTCEREAINDRKIFSLSISLSLSLPELFLSIGSTKKSLERISSKRWYQTSYARKLREREKVLKEKEREREDTEGERKVIRRKSSRLVFLEGKDGKKKMKIFLTCQSLCITYFLHTWFFDFSLSLSLSILFSLLSRFLKEREMREWEWEGNTLESYWNFLTPRKVVDRSLILSLDLIHSSHWIQTHNF